MLPDISRTRNARRWCRRRHNGNGAVALAFIMRELFVANVATEIGCAWSAFIAFGTDWDQAVHSVCHHFLHIESMYMAEISEMAGSSTPLFLGLASPLLKSFLVERRILNIRFTCSCGYHFENPCIAVSYRFDRCFLGEAAAMWHLIAKRLIRYAPHVGTLAPILLHAEYSTFLFVVLARLCIRCSVSRISLTASRNVGGFQLVSVVECGVSAVAN